MVLVTIIFLKLNAYLSSIFLQETAKLHFNKTLILYLNYDKIIQNEIISHHINL